MRIRRALVFTLLPLCSGLGASRVAAEGGGSIDAVIGPEAKASSKNPSTSGSALSAYFSVLRDKRLAPQTADVAELRARLKEAEALALDEHHEQAALLLFELVESPRFADYAELQELDAARYSLGSSLHALGAAESARRYLRQVIDEGTDSEYFAPAFRRYIDVALAQLDLAAASSALSSLPFALPVDARDELGYLKGRERFDAGDDAAASTALAEVSTRSRFYANAQYLLGAIASRQKKYRSAEQHFCRIASPSDTSGTAFRVDQRYFQVKDLARLGLGRVAHEQRRSDDAFYYYFQVPEDSARLPEAMFEAAYATYEGGDHQSSLDLLDQLEARFPHSPYADEASILRGYAALAGCDFDKARQLFTRFIEHFAPVAVEIDRIQLNPARREALYEELARAEKAPQRAPAVRKTLLALLHVDPEFVELHERVRKLDAEAARSSRVPELLDLIGARLAGSDRPRATAQANSEAPVELAAMQEELRAGRQAVRTLGGQLDEMRVLGAAKSSLAPLEQELAALEGRLRKLESRVEAARVEARATRHDDTTGVEPLLARDLALARGFERRVSVLRPQLVTAANEKALAELAALRARLGGFLRRARIGRIDAIMGSKRRIEIQIESLAAGRFPAELRDPLRVQGFLADDEEYWPFEGEDWPDEFKERYQAADGGDETKPEAP